MKETEGEKEELATNYANNKNAMEYKIITCINFVFGCPTNEEMHIGNDE